MATDIGCTSSHKTSIRSLHSSKREKSFVSKDDLAISTFQKPKVTSVVTEQKSIANKNHMVAIDRLSTKRLSSYLTSVALPGFEGTLNEVQVRIYEFLLHID